MDLDLVTIRKNERHATTCTATRRVPNPRIKIEFSDWTCPDDGKPNYIAEFFDTASHFYLGAVQTWYEAGLCSQQYEHFEVGVSPSGKYDEHNNPVEGQGELWQFYEGKSLAWAVRSFKMGGAKDGRKPVRKW